MIMERRVASLKSAKELKRTANDRDLGILFVGPQAIDYNEIGAENILTIIG